MTADQFALAGVAEINVVLFMLGGVAEITAVRFALVGVVERIGEVTLLFLILCGQYELLYTYSLRYAHGALIRCATHRSAAPMHPSAARCSGALLAGALLRCAHQRRAAPVP